MNTPALPPLLAANPRLDRWVGFSSPGRVKVSTGRVEIGQGVLTAMLQIAAEELEVAPERILLQTGDTDLTPNEGYTAGSQSIQFGGVALRVACAEVRALFLDHAAASHGYSRGDLAVRDGALLRSSSALAEIRMPERQYPHCPACSSRKACCSGCGRSGVPSPSIVVITFPATVDNALPQDFSGRPSTNTMQQPHCSWPQPNLVPTRPK